MILGIIASSISGSKTSTTAYEQIATVTVSSSVSTISFSSIPSTYSHLQLRGASLFDFNDSSVYYRINGDTGTNYTYHYLAGNGSSASAGSSTGQTRNIIEAIVVGHSTTAPFASVTDFLDYTSTNKYKVTRTLSGCDRNGSGEINLFSGLWLSTSAITSIELSINGRQFTSGSKYALYGIKA